MTEDKSGIVKAFTMTDEEYEDLMSKIEDFQDSLFSYLAGTSKYELIPLTDKYGTPLAEEKVNLLKRESLKKGNKILYAVEYVNYIRITNPETLKTTFIYNGGDYH